MLETDIRGTAVETAWIIQGFKIEEKQYATPPAEGVLLFYANNWYNADCNYNKLQISLEKLLFPQSRLSGRRTAPTFCLRFGNSTTMQEST